MGGKLQKTLENSSEAQDMPRAFYNMQEELEHHIFARAANSRPGETLPNTIKEAYTGPDADLWRSTVEEELLSLNSNYVYETVPIPDGVTPIISKLVF